MSTVSPASSVITIHDDHEELVIDPTAKKRPPLERDEARLLTTEIQRTSVRLWLLVCEAHDRQAHLALGYESWDDYVRVEFKMSPSRSYQLIDTGHVMQALAAAGADIEHMAPPPTRVVSRIKDRLPAVRKAAKRAIKAGNPPDVALRELAREPRQPNVVRGEVIPQPRGAEAAEPEEGRPKTGVVTCPACEGEGQVPRSLANRLRKFMKDLTDSE